MMYALLRQLSRTPLTLATVEEFLLRAAKLVVIREITIDDWVYLVHLVAYRAATRLGADDRQKAVMAKLLDKIQKDKDRLDHMFN